MLPLVLAFASGVFSALVAIALYNFIADMRAEQRAVAMFGAAIEHNEMVGAHYEGDDFIRGSAQPDPYGNYIGVVDGPIRPWTDPLSGLVRASNYAAAGRTPVSQPSSDSDAYADLVAGGWFDFTDDELAVVSECGF